MVDVDISNTEISTTVNKNWNKQNTVTLLKWIAIGSSYIRILEKNIKYNRIIIRANSIFTIAITTATGSIGVSQISAIFPGQLQTLLTILLTVLSFFLTILTGAIKVYLIHENLEKYIQIKQEWTSFIATISTELQLPKEERQDALNLIRDNKSVYLTLLNKDVELTKIMKKDDINDYRLRYPEYKKLYDTVTPGSKISISEITSRIVKNEINDIVDMDYEMECRIVEKYARENAENRKREQQRILDEKRQDEENELKSQLHET